MSGALYCLFGPQDKFFTDDDHVPGVTIAFTGTGVPPNLVATTGDEGKYAVQFPTPTMPGTYTIQAHFAGFPLWTDQIRL